MIPASKVNSFVQCRAFLSELMDKFLFFFFHRDVFLSWLVNLTRPRHASGDRRPTFSLSLASVYNYSSRSSRTTGRVYRLEEFALDPGRICSCGMNLATRVASHFSGENKLVESLSLNNERRSGVFWALVWKCLSSCSSRNTSPFLRMYLARLFFFSLSLSLLFILDFSFVSNDVFDFGL